MGNQFSGLANGLFEAEMCGRPCVFSDLTQRGKFGSLLDLPEIITLPDHISTDTASYWCQKALAHKNFSHGFWADPPPMNITKTMFNKYLSPLLKRPLVDGADADGTLIVHLRGGDIMGRTDAAYMPAPCAFYQHVIQRGNEGQAFNRVTVISDDEEHPCFSMIAQVSENMKTSVLINVFVVSADVNNSAKFSNKFGIEYTRASMEDDFMFLVSGTNIALSTSSTFGLSGVAMNPRDQVDVFMPTYYGENMCCDGNFHPERLTELCSFGQLSNIFEFPFPKGYSSRPDFISEFAIDANTKVHDCTSLAEVDPSTAP